MLSIDYVHKFPNPNRADRWLTGVDMARLRKDKECSYCNVGLTHTFNDHDTLVEAYRNKKERGK